MTGFHEVRFPDNIAYGATGEPEFATAVVATSAGYEKRKVNWSELPRPPARHKNAAADEFTWFTIEVAERQSVGPGGRSAGGGKLGRAGAGGRMRAPTHARVRR